VEAILQYWPLVFLAVVLVAAAVWDVAAGKIPNSLTYPAIAVGLIGHTLTGGLGGEGSLGAQGLAGALAGFAAGFLPLMLAWLAGGLGGGDAKLMGGVGALMGWKFTLMAMFWGLALAGLLAVVVMLRRRIAMRTLARVGRFLLLAILPGKGQHVDPATADSPTVPFGLALCLGTGVAVLQTLLGF
jgi:prepilin peptidase CpaA